MQRLGTGGGATIGIVTYSDWERGVGLKRSDGGSAMGQWLIADVSFLDVHVQLWMLLVVGVLLIWLAAVWATR